MGYPWGTPFAFSARRAYKRGRTQCPVRRFRFSTGAAHFVLWGQLWGQKMSETIIIQPASTEPIAEQEVSGPQMAEMLVAWGQLTETNRELSNRIAQYQTEMEIQASRIAEISARLEAMQPPVVVIQQPESENEEGQQDQETELVQPEIEPEPEPEVEPEPKPQIPQWVKMFLGE